MRLVLPLLLIGSGAWAECPTAADLAQGIRLHWSDGHVTTIVSTDDPVTLNVRTDLPRGYHRIEAWVWGLYDLETLESSEEPINLPTNYHVPPSEMPQPTAETRVTFPRVSYPGGPLVPVNREVYHMGTLGNVTLAGCSYRAFEVTLETTNLVVPDDVSQNDPGRASRVARGWAYLVDLGFAVESWINLPVGGTLASNVIAIEAVR